MAAIIGFVDAIVEERLVGWAFDPAAPNRVVTVSLYGDGDLICTLSANQFRDDLFQAGHGDGRHGFAVRLPLEIFTAPVIIVKVLADDGSELVGSPARMRNRQTVIDRQTLASFGEAVYAAAASAKSADDLHGLSSWMVEHFGVVYQRQASLMASARARRGQFFDLIGEDVKISDVLRNAAEAVVTQYEPLHLAQVAQPRVSVLIPAFNQFSYTYRCLASILEHLPNCSIEILVIDDGSTDETVFAALVLSGSIRLLRTPRNVGFLGAVMLGSAAATGEFLMLLNNDTEVQAGWLDELVGTFDRDDRIGIAGSKLLFPDRTLQEAGGIIWRQANGWNFGRNQNADDPAFSYMRDADYVSGAALMIRRTLFDSVGGLSVEFAPAYYEDTDLCFKVQALNYRVVVQPLSRVVHWEGISAGTDVNGRTMKRHQRINQRIFLNKWSSTLQSHELSGSDPWQASERLVTRRALFIDDTVPTPDRDAGSNAATSHMKSLQRLGYKVYFVGADNMAKISPYTDQLERLGIQCFYAPFFWSVEEVFRRERAAFDIVYVHRVMNYVKYGQLIRVRYPDALVIFNVADLHHLRLEREASVKEDTTARLQAATMKAREIASARAADRVIVHSTYERELLQELVPDAVVTVVPWELEPAKMPLLPFGQRRGFAFIGGYNHVPNVDAAEWLIRDILPLIYAQDPSIECLLVGSQIPTALRTMKRPGLRVIGYVEDLPSLLAGLRLTVAPLRYGAGLKGKVLTSLAAGLPCVSTPCAVEGMNLPADFGSMVAPTAAEFAATILRLYSDEDENDSLAKAGIAFIRDNFSASRIDHLMEGVVKNVPSDLSHSQMDAEGPSVTPSVVPGTRKRRAVFEGLD